MSAALCVFAALAAATPWLSALPAVACAVLSLSAIIAAAMALRSLRSPPFVRIAYRGDGWLLIDRAGVEHAALLRAHRHLGAFVTLDWRCAPRARFRVVLAPDNLDAETRRRLIVLLRRVAHADDAAAVAR